MYTHCEPKPNRLRDATNRAHHAMRTKCLLTQSFTSVSQRRLPISVRCIQIFSHLGVMAYCRQDGERRVERFPTPWQMVVHTTGQLLQGHRRSLYSTKQLRSYRYV